LKKAQQSSACIVSCHVAFTERKLVIPGHNQLSRARLLMPIYENVAVNKFTVSENDSSFFLQV
jgi:hypothetical protein